MNKKIIIFGSFFVVLLLIMLPSISATQSNTDTQKETTKIFENLGIPHYIWFAIYILILSIANRLNRTPL